MVEYPVLYMTFARPEYARQSFNAIKKAKPKKLYFYSNKARTENFDEIKRNKEIRNYINEIDWDCNLKTWFRDEYVDIYTSLLGAMNWVFENEEDAIVIEEDVVANSAFFSFCGQMLLKYKEDQRIWMIAGSNYIEGYNPLGHDYIFSHNMPIHGWASWRDRWKKVDFENPPLDKILEEKVLASLFTSKKEKIFFSENLRNTKVKLLRTKCWDGIFCTVGRSYGALSVIPSHNLITNIGNKGVHSNYSIKDLAYVHSTYKEAEYIIKDEPCFVIANTAYDKKLCEDFLLKNHSLFFKIKNKLRLILEGYVNLIIL
jgi:hypothetical protein